MSSAKYFLMGLVALTFSIGAENDANLEAAVEKGDHHVKTRGSRHENPHHGFSKPGFSSKPPGNYQRLPSRDKEDCDKEKGGECVEKLCKRVNKWLRNARESDCQQQRPLWFVVRWVAFTLSDELDKARKEAQAAMVEATTELDKECTNKKEWEEVKKEAGEALSIIGEMNTSLERLIHFAEKRQHCEGCRPRED